MPLWGIALSEKSRSPRSMCCMVAFTEHSQGIKRHGEQACGAQGRGMAVGRLRGEVSIRGSWRELSVAMGMSCVLTRVVGTQIYASYNGSELHTPLYHLSVLVEILYHRYAKYNHRENGVTGTRFLSGLLLQTSVDW